jgi:hypothetical protein
LRLLLRLQLRLPLRLPLLLLVRLPLRLLVRLLDPLRLVVAGAAYAHASPDTTWPPFTPPSCT